VPPLLPRSKKLRTALLALVAIVFVAVAADLLANTSSSGNKSQPPKGSIAVRPPKGVTPLKLVVGSVVVQNTGKPAKVKLPVRRNLLRATQEYVQDAILTPLRTGRVDNSYDAFFDSGVKPAASGPDRPVLTEAGSGIARGPVHAVASPVRFDAIGDQNGNLALVATTFGLTARVSTPAGLLTITRLTELTFENEFGSWRVTAYDVAVRRRVGATTSSKRVSFANPGPTGVAS
jgi:hypothetical protein